MTLHDLLATCEPRTGATETEITAVERSLGQLLPDDYKAILRESNGLEGFFAPGAYLILWTTADIHPLNEAYSVAEFLNDVILLGTDGADTGYGFTWEGGKPRYISVPLVGMGPSEVLPRGDTFIGLLEQVSKLDLASRG